MSLLYKSLLYGSLHKPFRTLVAGCVLLLPCTPSLLQAQAQSCNKAPDNSGHNKNQKTTADQQPNGASDRELTAKIRRTIVADKSLSTYGHNVKIVTRDGAVTLKGPVHSDEEKQKIESEAAGVAGQDKVTDQLTVKQ